MRRLSAAALALAFVACEREPPPVQPYVHPALRPGAKEATCATLAHDVEGAAWSQDVLQIHVAKGPIAIADPSVLGGPFAPPLRVDATPGDHAVRVLLGKTRAGDARPICIELRLRPGDVRSFRPLGDVAIDTDMVAMVDEPAYVARVAKLGAPLFAGIEADADQLPALSKALAERGMPVERVFPTYVRATRPLAPNDRQLVKDALGAANADGKFVVEPESPAWDFLRAIGDKSFATIDLGDPPAKAGVVVESTNGDGAYVVAIGEGADGAALTVELRLAP